MTARDEEAVITSGLLEPTALDGVTCCACSEEAGLTSDGVFVAYAVLIDEADTPWFACYECLADVLDPVDYPQTDFYLDDDPDDYDLFR